MTICLDFWFVLEEQQGLMATGLGGSCREEAVARRPWHGRPNNKGLCRQTAGCNAGAAGAYGHRAGWKLPRGSCREEAAARKLPRVPRGALDRDALTTEGYAGKRQAATLEQQGLTVTGLGGSCREEAAARRARQGRPKRQAATLEQQGLTARAGWKLPRGSCRAAR